ncbi:MAG TPA: alpha/beta hydrolase family protein [Mycobacteriales bacterium]|jgi:S-formylglutathione hydrolase FrmB|nr:alpha/beta hydrolase family protein [Mycobacteriales bacterium]
MTTRVTRWRSVAAGLAVTAAVGATGGAGTALGATADRSSVPSAPIHLRTAHGIVVKSVRRIGARQLLATIAPKALAPKSITVRILLPVGYAPSAEPRYPVLYLFPGTSGHSYDWMTAGDAPKTTKPYRLITVSSDIGFDGDGGSWFTNWIDQHTALGKSQWETYDIHELIPWIDANLDTIRSRSGRAVAGLSMGGYGATELAARHPQLFVQQASFSGAPEIDRDLEARLGAEAIIGATMVGLNGVEANAPFGNHISDEINWEGHDPARLITNLRPVRMWFATADGLPGQYDDPVTNPTGVIEPGVIESLTHVSTDLFLQHARQVGLSPTVYDYGSGTHTFAYWARDLRKFIGPLMKTFANPPARPARISYVSINPRWSQWGWQVSIARPQPLAFSRLSGADRNGFILGGDGTARVLTPRYYSPGGVYAVTKGGSAKHLVADSDGRLHISVPLGASPHKVSVTISAP